MSKTHSWVYMRNMPNMDWRLLLPLFSTGILVIAFLKKQSDMTQEFQDHLSKMNSELKQEINNLKDHLSKVHSEHKEDMNDLKVQLQQIVLKSNSECNNNVQKLQGELKNGTKKLMQDIKTLDMELYSSLGIAKCLPCISEDTSCIPCNMTWKDCADVYQSGYKKSGVYRIKAGNLPDPVNVYCEASNGGGWTVFQRRVDNSISFERKWQDYKTGFGDPRGSHWLGNDALAAITSGTEIYTLRIDLVNFSNEKRYAEYDSFQVRPENEKYKLIIGDYRGNAGDNSYGLSRQNGMDFTTIDQDNDHHTSNCASYNKGGWWYNNCHVVNHNGLFTNRQIHSAEYITWHAWNDYYSLKNSEMKLRPTNYISGYRGNAGDGGTGLSYHNGLDFSTIDMDHSTNNCAKSYHGGWWYRTCHNVNLNGLFVDKRIDSAKYMTWYAWDKYHSLKNSEMKLRPTTYISA